MAKKNQNSHFLHFIILLILLLASAGLVLFFNYYKTYQLAAAILLSTSYLAWGIIHHAKIGDLHSRVFMEYLAISFLGFTLLATLILKS